MVSLSGLGLRMGLHSVPGIGVTGVITTPDDPNTPYPFETWTPMHIIAAEGNSWVIQRLLEVNNWNNILHLEHCLCSIAKFSK